MTEKNQDMAKKPESEARAPPKMRKCGDDFEKSIPAGAGPDASSETFDKNHWKVVFDAYREEDAKQCELWKDEVNILLIFAGLFSAVVTAFLIESYKFLLPQGSPDPDKFGLDHGHVVRLNSLWFCSLVLSLSTVVIGIVALQWLRNHQRYHGIKPRDALSVYEMRTKALRAWHIRWTFLSLPLLILVALVLFFVGLVDFLLTLNKKVAAPVAVLVYATLAILFGTTVAPTCQIFWLSAADPEVEFDRDMPTPCPYKSPQSLLLLQFISYILRKFRNGAQKAIENVSSRQVPLHLTFYAKPHKWTDFDTRWLRLRDVYSQNMAGNYKQTKPYPSRSLQHPRRPIFDESKILLRTISTFNPSATVLFGAYHCFEEVSNNALYQGIESKDDYEGPKFEERNKILRGYYWKHLQLPGSKPLRYQNPISSFIVNPSHDLLHDENMLVFLEMHTSHNLPNEASRVISAHLCELQARILGHVYAADSAHHFALPTPSPQNANAATTPNQDEWLVMMAQQYIDMINSTNTLPKFKIWSHFAPSSLNGNEISVSNETINDSIIQLSAIFEQFVQQVADWQDDSPWDGTIYAHKDVAQLWKVLATMLRYTGTDQIPFDAFVHLNRVFNRIQVALSNPVTDDEKVDQTHTDYLFLSTCLFIEKLFDPYAELTLKQFKSADSCRRMGDLIKVLDSYERTGDALVRIKDNYDTLWTKTGLPEKPRFKFGNQRHIIASDEHTVGNRSYIRWQDVPSWIEIDCTVAAAPIPKSPF